jgi:hypothetical protein
VRLCARLLELKPSRRFQSANDVIRAIDEKRVPANRPRQRYFAIVAAVCLALLIVGGVVEWRRYMTPTSTTAPLASQSTTDLAPMPFVVSGGVDTDGDLAAGIRELMASTLIDSKGTNSEDVRRVDRALKELRFDADAARRQRNRVADTLNTRRLLEADLSRDDAGKVSLRLSLWTPGDAKPVWTRETPPSSEEALPAQLGELRKSLYEELGSARRQCFRVAGCGDDAADGSPVRGAQAR